MGTKIVGTKIMQKKVAYEKRFDYEKKIGFEKNLATKKNLVTSKNLGTKKNGYEKNGYEKKWGYVEVVPVVNLIHSAKLGGGLHSRSNMTRTIFKKDIRRVFSVPHIFKKTFCYS